MQFEAVFKGKLRIKNCIIKLHKDLFAGFAFNQL